MVNSIHSHVSKPRRNCVKGYLKNYRNKQSDMSHSEKSFDEISSKVNCKMHE
jgi:hypothetical protein